MAQRRWPTLVPLILGLGCVALAIPPAFLGVMGLLGIVADVSPSENRQFGWGFLRIASVPFVVGVVLLVTALWISRSQQQKHRDRA